MQGAVGEGALLVGVGVPRGRRGPSVIQFVTEDAGEGVLWMFWDDWLNWFRAGTLNAPLGDPRTEAEERGGGANQGGESS